MDEEEILGDLLIFTDRISDFINSLQSCYYDLHGYYLMGITEGTLDDLKSIMNSRSSDSLIIQNYNREKNLINTMIVRNGLTGENVFG